MVNQKKGLGFMRLDELELGKTVYSYNDPRHVVVPENSPVWECTVTGWRVFSTVKEFDEDKEEVEVFLDNGFSGSRRDLGEVFDSLDEAKKHAHLEMDKLLDKNSAWRGKLEQALVALLDQQEGDD